MSGCDAVVRGASAGVAASLRAVDCVSAEATSSAFSRLFGASGALLPALTTLLTLYVALFAVLLLTGRARLNLGSLTPRMVTIGLVLTFTTSWVAYQGVIWNLAVGAPDQIAGVLTGAHGSATELFADRIDILFNAIAETASSGGASAAPRPAAAGSFTPENLMWLGALLLMLGTVGVLVTARIALAVLLAVGPVFVTLVLFSGTRGLFAGWLRAVALTAITPLLAVLGGAMMTELAAPVVASLRGLEGIDGRAAMALFVIAAVHCALMGLALRVASTMVSAWSVFGIPRGGQPPASPADATAATHGAIIGLAMPKAHSVAPLMAGANADFAVGAGPNAATAYRPLGLELVTSTPPAAVRAGGRLRARGVGSRFSTPASAARKRLV